MSFSTPLWPRPPLRVWCHKIYVFNFLNISLIVLKNWNSQNFNCKPQNWRVWFYTWKLFLPHHTNLFRPYPNFERKGYLPKCSLLPAVRFVANIKKASWIFLLDIKSLWNTWPLCFFLWSPVRCIRVNPFNVKVDWLELLWQQIIFWNFGTAINCLI